jgi:hypothetical protein
MTSYIRKIVRPNEAVVGIIVTILLIGLFIIITGIIQTVYVPQWMEQKEAEHMHIASYQFTQLKQIMDILAVTEQENAISAYITLGTADIPIFGVGRTYDDLNIFTDNCSVQISNNTTSSSFSLGTLAFSSKNSYFVDQSYIYQAGALIMSQSGGNILNGRPFLSINDYINISFNIINISSLDAKKVAGGYGTYSVYIEYQNSTVYTFENLSYINITTNYKNSWRTFFNSSNLKLSLLTYQVNDTATGISVKFSDILGKIELKVSEFSVQIAPGWIE